MSASEQRPSGSNEGIQGNVTAEVVAVGRNARAIKITKLSGEDKAELEQAIAQLHKAIESLKIPTSAQETLKADVSRLQTVAASDKPDRDKVGSILENIAGKLKMVGAVAANTVALFEPLGKIAGLFHLSLAAIGLL
jgi:hypothetical protein